MKIAENKLKKEFEVEQESKRAADEKAAKERWEAAAVARAARKALEKSRNEAAVKAEKAKVANGAAAKAAAEAAAAEAEKEALEGQVASLRAELVQLYQWLSMKREEEESKSPAGNPGRYSPPRERGMVEADLRRLGRSHGRP